MNDLDELLHDALTADADRAPELPAKWIGPTTARVVPIATGRSTRRVVMTAAGIAAAAAVVGALALVARPDDPAAPVATTAPSPAAWQPPGTEFPIVDLGPATESQGGPVVAALTRRVGVPGFAERIVAPSLTYHDGPTAELEYCVWSDRGGQCRPEWYPLNFTYSDDGDADGGLFTFDGLPVGTAFVGYSDGETEYWQRPVFGFAAFPNLPGSAEVVTAWNADGLAIDTVDFAAYADTTVTVPLPPGLGLSDGVRNDVFQFTWSSLAGCLTDRGGTLNGQLAVATFPEGIDQVAVWNECVTEVKTVVAERVAELT